MALQIKRGLEANRLSYTPALGEPIFITDTKKVYVGDGATAGGIIVSGSGFDSDTNQRLLNLRIDSDWVIRYVGKFGGAGKVDSEWVLKSNTEKGSIEGVSYNTTNYTANVATTSVTRVNNGSSNPDINTTINSAVVGNLVEYDIAGVFYPVNGWIVRKNTSTFDTLVIKNGTVIYKAVVNTSDSEDEVLTFVTAAAETYVRDLQFSRDKTQNISVYHFFGGKMIDLVQNDFNYTDSVSRNAVIGKSLYNLLISIKLLNRAIDSEMVARKLQISQLPIATNDKTYPDSDWIRRKFHEQVDSDWVIRKGGVQPGDLLQGTIRTGGQTAGNLNSSVSWKINGGTAVSFDSMLGSVVVGNTVQNSSNVNAEGFARKWYNSTTDYYVVAAFSAGKCVLKETINLKGNYTTYNEGLFECPPTFALSDGRTLYPGVMNTYNSSTNTAFHNGTYYNPTWQYSKKSYVTDSERNVIIDSTSQAIRGELAAINAKFTPITTKIATLVDSDVVKRLIDSDHVLGKVRDKKTYRIEPRPTENITTAASPSSSGSTVSIAYNSTTKIWTINGTTNPVSGLYWSSSASGGRIPTVVYIRNGVVLDYARSTTYTSMSAINFITVRGAKYTLGTVSNAIGTMTWDGVSYGTSNMFGFTRVIDSDTWWPGIAEGLNLDGFIDATSSSIDYLYQKAQAVQAATVNVHIVHAAGETFATSYSPTETSNPTAGIYAVFPLDTYVFGSDTTLFNTSTYTFTVRSEGYYLCEVALIQGTTTYATQARIRHSTTASAVTYSHVMAFENTSQETRTDKWMKYCYPGETFRLEYDGTLKNTTAVTFRKL